MTYNFTPSHAQGIRPMISIPIFLKIEIAIVISIVIWKKIDDLARERSPITHALPTLKLIYSE